MGQKHGWSTALPDLEWLDMKMTFVVENIDQYLGCVTNLFNGFKGMMIPDQCEISNCIQFEQVGAGHSKKVSNHVICRPG